ncbi:hypothetical protein [Bacillus pretiosus]
MEFKKTTNFLYQMASIRIKWKIEESGLTRREIHEKDPNLISNITNNKRYKNNRYLIPDVIVPSLVSVLSFNNEHDLFWGTEEEIHAYVGEIFKRIMIDLLEESHKQAKLVNDILVDYVPFARYSTYCESMSTSKGCLNDALRNSFAEYAYLYSITREQAICRLYNQKLSNSDVTVKVFFRGIFMDFTNELNKYKENKGFKKLPRRLNEFVNQNLFPIINEFLPDEKSLGRRVQTLIRRDISLLDMMPQLKNTLPEYQFSNGGVGFVEIANSLKRASENYIDNLEQIQVDIEGIPKRECNFSFDEWENVFRKQQNIPE